MPADHGVRITDHPAEIPAPVTAAPPVREPLQRVLALQRSAGNAAVARLLQRQGWPDARRDPGPGQDGGWNAAARDVAGTVRIAVAGVSRGNQEKDPQSPATKESAAGRAIVVVPDAAELTHDVEVLLFFHGMGNVGFRERATAGEDEGAAGTVHDVEDDRIPQQLAHSKRNMVAVLPQGTDGSSFGIANPQEYVTEVLGLALKQLPALRPKLKLPTAITPARVIVAGHSGGGPPAVGAARALSGKKPPADDDEWAGRPGLFLFDGINGTSELDGLWQLVERWLGEDLAQLKSSANPDALLDRRGIKLRSTHTVSAMYTALNVGGSYVWKHWVPTGDLKPDGKPELKRVAETVTIAPDDSLRGRIDKWFATKAKALGKPTDKWHEQYDVPAKAESGHHEYTVGTGQTAEEEGRPRVAAPAGVTGASKDAKVPDYDGGGHLEQSLAKLPGKDREGAAKRAEAKAVKRAIARDGPTTQAPPARSPLATKVKAAWDAGKDKGKVFDVLRREVGALRASGDGTVDADTDRCLQAIFAAGSDDLWLAQKLNAQGPEPLWNAADLDARDRLAEGHKWAPERGDITGLVRDPDPTPGGRSIPPVRVHLFPGQQPHRRALVIGGVHGSEPQGVAVVEKLRERLAAAPTPPLLTTILVPTLIEATAKPRDPKTGTLVAGPRNVRRDEHARPGGGEIEPNRNFPLPGTSYAEARKLGKDTGTELRTPDFDKRGEVVPGSKPHAPDLDQDRTTVNMLPETRVLVTLLERFHPERIASVHAHGLGSTVGDAPGIFVDPRADDPATRSDERKEDDQLAHDMLTEAQKLAGTAAPKGAALPKGAFSGNAPAKGSPDANVHYSSSAHVPGVSLGMYGPVAVAGVRQGAATVTVEVPQWDLSGKRDDLDALIDVHAQTLQDVFLGR